MKRKKGNGKEKESQKNTEYEAKAQKKDRKLAKRAERKQKRLEKRADRAERQEQNKREKKPFRYKRQIKAAAIAAGCVILSAGLGTAFTDTKSQWYLGLVKSPIQPPDWVFPIAWSIVYLTIGISLYRVLLKDGFSRKTVCLHLLNLALLALWPYVFFYKQNAEMAMILLTVIFLVAAYTTMITFQKDALAGWMLVPELVWLGFAAVLNYTIAMLN